MSWRGNRKYLEEEMLNENGGLDVEGLMIVLTALITRVDELEQKVDKLRDESEGR